MTHRIREMALPALLVSGSLLLASAQVGCASQAPQADTQPGGRGRVAVLAGSGGRMVARRAEPAGCAYRVVSGRAGRADPCGRKRPR